MPRHSKRILSAGRDEFDDKSDVSISHVVNEGASERAKGKRGKKEKLNKGPHNPLSRSFAVPDSRYGHAHSGFCSNAIVPIIVARPYRREIHSPGVV